EQLKSLNLTGWDTSSVQYTTNMFYNCTQLKALDLSDWNANQIRWMNNMFANCYQLEKLDLSSWDIGELDRTDNMFSDCTQLQELNLSGWDTSNVTVMVAMFSNCAQLQKLNLSGWDTSSVQYMMGIFSGCDNLSKVILSSDFKFGDFHHLPFFPPNSGTTTYHWVKDDYTDVYDSTNAFTEAHNNLTETATNHVYTIQKKHKVSFDLNDGSGKAPDPQYIFEGKLADKPDYEGTKGDLFFDCWTLNSLPFTFDTPITEPVELVASWRKARYTIKFDANKGEGTMSDQVLSIDEEKSLSGNQFTRKGYDFVEWNEESDGSGDSYSDKEAVKNLSTTEGAQIKLYAQWKPITYTINFDSKNGSSISPKTYTIETGIDSFETPTRLGYTFEGWYEGKNKVTKIEKGETGNRTLIAKWTPVTYQVTFDSAGGSTVAPITFTTENSVTKLPEPARIGYRFLGWYDDDTKVTELPKGTIGDKTLTAKWEKIKSIEVIENILKEENQKNRKEQDYTEDSWKVYQEAKKAAEDLLKEVNPDPLKAEQVLAKLQSAIQGLTLKDATAPKPVGTTNTPVSKKVYPTAQAKQYPRMNMVTTIWPGFIGTGLVAAVIALIKKNKK
ncbi:InlB B-repeat-containing protein, partial [Enterococcus gilvus]|uniref:InlB B-repeat-containing protein n=1 Tax=Enterococcus gilvus TaxID=160453 RepID=UPI001C8CE8E3